MDTIQRWPIWVRVFHWGTVLLMIALWLSVSLHGWVDDRSSFYIGLHKSLGVLFFLWILSRFTNRLMHRSVSPASVAGPRWQMVAASLTHGLLYGLLLLMPLAGIIYSQAGGRPVSFFGLFNVPTLVLPDPDIRDGFRSLHKDILWLSILGLTGLHIAGALYHQFVLKDKLINRMR